MRFHIRVAIIPVAVILFPLALYSQSPVPSRSFRLEFATAPAPDSSFQLPDQFLVPSTDSLVLDFRIVLQRNADYHIDPRHGLITFDSSFVSSLGRTRHVVTGSYRYIPFVVRDSYALRTVVVLRDTAGTDTLRVARPAATFNIDDIFGSDLQKSGSIFRGFTVGSNRDLTLNSGLRLQLSGKIANDVDVVASLTDENTPIQPEGTTQTLQEFDKVFVEIRGTHYAATLGDFNLEFNGTEFGRLTRKLQGARGTASYTLGKEGFVTTLAGAVPRGKFVTNQLIGVEGVQGPYRLTGKNGERNIIVIAGTEKVYIDGLTQVRGETNDYVIDYATGEVTFTTRRLITSASRITIDFEYTDRQYSRSLLAAQQSADLFGSAARLTVQYVREADDPDHPVDLTLSDSARTILAAAGADRNRAVVSGVSQVDSNGFYIRIDTVLTSGQPASFYRYAPGKGARYLVSFSNVGLGNGEYIRQQLGVFVWKGVGGGDYLPLQFLPLPQLQQQIDLHLDAIPVQGLTLTGEYAGSSFDANRLSVLDNPGSEGHAYTLGAALRPTPIVIDGNDLGELGLNAHTRFVGRTFATLDRFNEVEFNRKWGLDSLSSGDERILEAGATYRPVPAISLSSNYGEIRRGPTFRSIRNDGSVTTTGENIPLVSYVLESIRSRQPDQTGSWLRQRGSAEYAIGVFTPAVRYEGERREFRSTAGDSVIPGSFRFDLMGFGGKVIRWGNVSLGADYEIRSDGAFLGGTVEDASRSFTQTYGGKLAAWNNITSSLDVTLRKKTITPLFKQQGLSDITTVLVRNQTRYTPLNRGIETDLFYEAATERASRLERIFVKVTQGSGNYMYLGDLNGNGVADEAEFALTRFDGDYVAVTVPTDELFPVIDLKTSARIRVRPSLFLHNDRSVLEQALSLVTTETYVRIEEKSKEADLKQIYLLHFSRFQQDSTTISGATIITQDINILEGSPDFSARFRFSQRKGMTNLSGGIERTYGRERSVRLRWQLVDEVANQLDYVNTADRVAGGSIANRQRAIASDALTLDFSYRPEQKLEVGMKFDLARSLDSFESPPVAADFNAQTVRCVYAFRGAGQLRVEGSREEIILNGTSSVIPFELTGGRVAGRTWFWRVAFDYRVTQFIQANLNYDGRLEGDRSPVHTARAEVRAFF